MNTRVQPCSNILYNLWKMDWLEKYISWLKETIFEANSACVTTIFFHELWLYIGIFVWNIILDVMVWFARTTLVLHTFLGMMSNWHTSVVIEKSWKSCGYLVYSHYFSTTFDPAYRTKNSFCIMRENIKFQHMHHSFHCYQVLHHVQEKTHQLYRQQT